MPTNLTAARTLPTRESPGIVNKERVNLFRAESRFQKHGNGIGHHVSVTSLRGIGIEIGRLCAFEYLLPTHPMPVAIYGDENPIGKACVTQRAHKINEVRPLRIKLLGEHVDFQVAPVLVMETNTSRTCSRVRPQ
jgi:hypothetical protein